MEEKTAHLTLGEKLFVWFEANKKQAAWGAGLTILVAFVFSYYLWSQGAREVKAGEALSKVMVESLFSGTGRPAAPESFVRVAEAHPGTPAAAQALLLAGGGLFTEGKYAEAHAVFQRFTREYAGHPFVSQALLGIAASLEAQGKTAEAVEAYKVAMERNPGAHTVVQAKFGMARNYEAEGKLDQARSLYEEIARSEPYSSTGNEAAFRLERLRQEQPVAATETPAATPPPTFQLSTPSP